eukprot:2749723-Alexandrium_andersonii.AAC.1
MRRCRKKPRGADAACRSSSAGVQQRHTARAVRLCICARASVNAAPCGTLGPDAAPSSFVAIAWLLCCTEA